MSPLSVDLPHLPWMHVPNWTRIKLLNFGDLPGLLEFSERNEIVYVGMEAVSLPNFRRFVTPGGSWQSHPAGHLVHENRFRLTLRIAIYNQPASEIERVRNILIELHQPRFNFEDHEIEPKAKRLDPVHQHHSTGATTCK
jgi:hypothetical protein